MKILNGFFELRGVPRPCVATIGNFDGMHAGHQRIFARVRQRAFALDLPAVAVTFEPHPLKVLLPDRAPRMILTRLQKIELIRSERMDALVFIPFDRAVAGVEAGRFVELFLCGGLGVRELYIGVDFRFGRRRGGGVDLLREMGPARGFTVETVETVTDEGERISASRIRAALARGDVEAARRMMGRPYEAVGEVVHGAGRGRTQGTPTANLDVLNEMMPCSGVYITEARVPSGESGSHWPSLTHIGIRPTYPGAGFAVETWIPEYSGDLYGRTLRVRFHRRVRDEIRFPSPEALREQIGRDLQAMREFFS